MLVPDGKPEPTKGGAQLITMISHLSKYVWSRQPSRKFKYVKLFPLDALKAAMNRISTSKIGVV